MTPTYRKIEINPTLTQRKILMIIKQIILNQSLYNYSRPIHTITILSL